MLKLWITALALLFSQQISPMDYNIDYANEPTPPVAATVIADLKRFQQENPREYALQKAAQKGDYEKVQSLITAGVNVNAKAPWRQTALEKAAEEGHKNICKLLIKHGAITIDDSSGNPLWREAILCRDFVSVDIFLEMDNHKAKKATITAFLGCLKKKKGKDIVATNLYNNAQPFLQHHYNAYINSGLINQKDHSGYTILMEAARYANQESCEWLIAHGADVNMQNNQHGKPKTALSIAREHQRLQQEKMLMARENPRDHWQVSTSWNTMDPIVALLLARGAIEDEAN